MPHLRIPLIVALALASMNMPAWAGRLGPEFQVNTTSSFSTNSPSVAALTDGGFVAVWSDDHDGSGAGIYGQRYAADGTPAGGEFGVNTFTDSDQSAPAVAGLSDGGFIAVWQSDGQDGSGFGIYGQRYAADGSTVGSELRANTYTDDDQSQSAVAGLANGGFVIAWVSEGQVQANVDGVYAQRYRSDGKPVRGEFLLDTRLNSFDRPSVAGLTNGNFVITWVSSGGLFGQQFRATGEPVGDTLRVNTTDSAALPSVAALSTGGFVVAWQLPHTDSSDISARIFRANEAPVTGDILVNDTTGERQTNPSVAGLAQHDFVVVWDGPQNEKERSDVRGQQFNAQGRLRGNEFLANTHRYRSGIGQATLSLSTAGLVDGSYVVVWLGNNKKLGIFGRRFSAR